MASLEHRRNINTFLCGSACMISASIHIPVPHTCPPIWLYFACVVLTEVALPTNDTINFPGDCGRCEFWRGKDGGSADLRGGDDEIQRPSPRHGLDWTNLISIKASLWSLLSHYSRQWDNYREATDSSAAAAPQTLGYGSVTARPVRFKQRLIMVNGMVHICHSQWEKWKRSPSRWWRTCIKSSAARRRTQLYRICMLTWALSQNKADKITNTHLTSLHLYYSSSILHSGFKKKGET